MERSLFKESKSALNSFHIQTIFETPTIGEKSFTILLQKVDLHKTFNIIRKNPSNILHSTKNLRKTFHTEKTFEEATLKQR